MPSLGMLVGPGVVRAGHVDDLRAFARAIGCGVVNTWGAKGVFAWDDPLHFGTAGLQALDFELAGLASVDTLLTSGLDPLEVTRRPWEPDADVIDIAPDRLVWAAASGDWPRPTAVAPGRPRLYTDLARVLAPLYASESVPLSPARAASDLAAALPPGGMVAADPGPAGLWVARTFPTSEPGSVVVPATRGRGQAVALAAAAVRAGRPAVAVTHAPLDDVSAAAIEDARSEGLALVVEVWGEDAALSDPAERVAALVAAMARPGVDVLGVPVDFAMTRVLVDIAGEVVAWLPPPTPQPL